MNYTNKGEWLLCPVCKSKTRVQVREDTELKNFPLSQREADKKAAEYKRSLENGEVGMSKKMRVADFAEIWLETYKKPVLTAKSFENVKRQVEKVVLPPIGNLRLVNVTDIHLQNVLNTRAGGSFSDVKKLRDNIKALFRKAKESRLIVYDPAEFLKMPKCTKGTHRSITDLERTHFLKVAEEHYAGLMFQTMLYCGLRSGEVCALSWKDIDFSVHMLNIVAALESGTGELKAPKTDAGVRAIPIPDVLFDKLIKSRPEDYSLFAAVFTQETTGKRHTEYSVRSSWKSFKTAMDFSMGALWEKRTAKDGSFRHMKASTVIAPDLVPYCLRHTYCTNLQQKGVQLKTASYLMGHTDISVTANIYTHITEDSLAEAARLIGASGVRGGVRSEKTG